MAAYQGMPPLLGYRRYQIGPICVAVIIRNEESDIKAMALEILGSIALHPLAAAAVSACLPAAHIDDLLDHGPLLLQHSLQQLKAALATHV